MVPGETRGSIRAKPERERHGMRQNASTDPAAKTRVSAFMAFAEVVKRILMDDRRLESVYKAVGVIAIRIRSS